MKKTVSVLLIFLLVISTFGCKVAPIDEDDTAVTIIENETPSDNAEEITDNQENKGAEDGKETETNEGTLLQDTEKETVTETETDKTPKAETEETTETEKTETNEAAPEKEKMTPPYFADVVSPDDEPASEPFEISIDENFTDDIVMVLIKRGYSAVKQEYTVEDFPYLELKNLEVGQKYRPENKNRISLHLYLKHPSKQNVIDAVYELQKDERIYLANPNWVFSSQADEFLK